MKIVFFGSDDFGVDILKILNQSIDKNKDQIFIITRSSKRSGRGMKILKNKVSIFADEANLTYLECDDFKDSELNLQINNLNFDLMFVASFGKIIPEWLINKAKYTCNVHPSMLPKWRGAAPISRSIESGEEISEVCLIKIHKELDAGDIILRKDFQIEINDNYQNVYQKVIQISKDLIFLFLKNIEDLYNNSTPQVINSETYAYKITNDELMIDFEQDVKLIYNKIRSKPTDKCCYFIDTNGMKIKIIEAYFVLENHKEVNGNIDKKGGRIACLGGFIVPKKLQKEGKGAVNAKDFWNGYR